MDTQRQTLPPADSSIEAAVRLLSDDDPNVARVCRRQLLSWGAASRAALCRATDGDDARIRARARSLLRSLDLYDWAARMCQLGARAVGARRDGEALLQAALQLAAFDRPDEVDVARVARSVCELADELRPSVAGRSSRTAARNLAGLLAGRHGYTGCRTRQLQGEHVLVDHVIARRKGASATLAALYLLVGRRAGLQLTAVRLEPYFLVRVHGRRNVLIDPFHGGRSVTKADCIRYLRASGARAISARLADVDDADLLVGCLDELSRVHEQRGGSEPQRVIGRVCRFLAAL